MKLNTLNLHLTNRCNMQCRHCLYDSGKLKMDEMTHEEIINLLNEFITMTNGKGTLNLFGGEVFLRDDAFDIIDFAVKKGLQVGITTNVKNPKEVIDRLCKTDVKRLTVDVDGHDAENHEFLRVDKGHFDKSTKAIKKIVKSGKFTTSNVILHKKNAPYIEDILYLCKDLGISFVSCYLFTPLGRGIEMKNLVIGPQEWKELKKRVENWIEKEKPKFGIIWERSYEYENKVDEIHPRLCEGGEAEVIDVRCDGEVVYCGLLSSVKEGHLGNVRKNKLEDILKRRKEKALKIDIGCPALAYASGANDKNLIDPRKSEDDIIPVCPYDWEVLNGMSNDLKKRFAHINI